MKFRTLANPDTGPIPPEGYAVPLAHGLDTWSETWDFVLEEKFYNRLTQAQRDARSLDQLGGQGVSIEVGPEIFQVAPFGATGSPWRMFNRDLQFMFRPSGMEWNTTVRYSSEGLWQVGFNELERRVGDVMNAIGRPRDSGIADQSSGGSVAVVSRIDYAFDFFSPSFTSDFLPSMVDSMVAPARAKWGMYGSHGEHGAEPETLRSGKLPGLQVEVYDKTKEITEFSGKDWFRTVWRWDERFPGHDMRDVWRIECRFGSDYLKDRNLRGTSAVLDNLSRITTAALIDRRMTVGDERRIRNRAMHPLWSLARQVAGDARIVPAIGRQSTQRQAAMLKSLLGNFAGTGRAYSVARDGAFDISAVDELYAAAREQILTDKRGDQKVDRLMERYSTLKTEPDK